MIELGRDILFDLHSASSREWLETNGLGGYASGTVSGAHTRRYHGLLIAATRPPVGRMVLLSKFEETLIIDGERYELSTNQYPGSIYPEGYRLLSSFRLDPFPIWNYKVDGIEIEKKVFLVHGENATVASWHVLKMKRSDKRDIMLEVRPLLAFRGHHHLRHADNNFNVEICGGNGLVSFTPAANAPALHLGHNATSVESTGYWYRNFEYAIERERGFDFTEDLFQPCILTFDLSGPATIITSTEQCDVAEAAALENNEIERRSMLIAASTPHCGHLPQTLVRVRQRSARSVSDNVRRTRNQAGELPGRAASPECGEAARPCPT